MATMMGSDGTVGWLTTVLLLLALGLAGALLVATRTHRTVLRTDRTAGPRSRSDVRPGR